MGTSVPKGWADSIQGKQEAIREAKVAERVAERKPKPGATKPPAKAKVKKGK